MGGSSCHCGGSFRDAPNLSRRELGSASSPGFSRACGTRNSPTAMGAATKYDTSWRLVKQTEHKSELPRRSGDVAFLLGAQQMTRRGHNRLPFFGAKIGSINRRVMLGTLSSSTTRATVEALRRQIEVCTSMRVCRHLRSILGEARQLAA